MNSAVLLHTVIPSGDAARCDYVIAYRYDGFPPAPQTRQQAEAVFQKANLPGTYSELLVKRGSTSRLVSNELWRDVPKGEVDSHLEKGRYVRVNLYKANPGHTVSEWTKLEMTGWRPFVEAMAKETPGVGWRVRTLFLPAGTSRQYDGLTADYLPDWSALGKGINMSLWDKVHPDLKVEDYMAKVNGAVSRYKVELYQVVESMTK